MVSKVDGSSPTSNDNSKMKSPISDISAEDSNTVPGTVSVSMDSDHEDHHMMNKKTSSSPPAVAMMQMSSREQHKQNILKLCNDKLQASEESKSIVQNIKKLYKTKILPLEEKYSLHSLCLPTSGAIQDTELDAKPMVLLLGQYSTGKTSFIRHLLGVDFPGMHIGPEPTSDKFMALIHGTSPKIIKGNTLTVMPSLPFFGLSQYGSRFLNHFNGSITDSPLLQFMTMIDTPGILSGEKQITSREYPFSTTAKWFADRADLILLLFDAHKLDISDEFKQVVETIRPHNDDKIRCVLNKSDAVNQEQLVRVYGSLMWNMGKLFPTPEVVRVYTGSYWDEPLQHTSFENMFNVDESWLLDELMRLPSVNAERKVNAIVKRIRLVKVHMCILGYLRQKMSRVSWIIGIGKYRNARKRQYLLHNLQDVFDIVRIHFHLPEGDMPNIDEFRTRLETKFPDFTVFPTLNQHDLSTLDNILLSELPNIMRGTSIASENEGGDEDGKFTPAVKASKSATVYIEDSNDSKKETMVSQNLQRESFCDGFSSSLYISHILL